MNIGSRVSPTGEPERAMSRNDRTQTAESTRAVHLHLPQRGPCLTLVIECQRPSGGGAAYPLAVIEQLSIGRGHERRLIGPSEGQLRLELPDPKMSSQHALIERHAGGWRLQDLGSKNGSLHNGAAIERATLADGDQLQLGHSVFLFHTQALSLGPADDEAPLLGLQTLAGRYRVQLARLARIAPTPISILLRGETGAGKEIVARAIHASSGRSGPFVAVNCGAITPTLIASQLFGHQKGAFSGALRDEPGFVRAAHGGTLFLDEIAELPAAAQATLLRVLQQSEVVPVGSAQPVAVDVRVLSATHQPLEQHMAEEGFRKDLYARLAGFVFSVPPLRERREDLGMLIAALLDKHASAAIRLRPEVALALLRYDWPLNVRELEQALVSAIALSVDGVLRLDDWPEAIKSARHLTQGVATTNRPSTARAATAQRAWTAEEAALRGQIVEQLRAAGGNISAAGRAMNKARQQMQRWMRRFAIERHEYDESDR